MVCYTLGPIFVVFFILSILITISYSPSYLSNSRNTTTLPKRGPTGKEKLLDRFLNKPLNLFGREEEGKIITLSEHHDVFHFSDQFKGRPVRVGSKDEIES